MRCEECLPLIEEYIDGELGERTSDRIAAHLSTCHACASEVAELEHEQEIYAHYQRDIAVTPAQWNKGALHPARGRMTIDTFLTLMAWHDDNHLDQLARALEGKA